MEVKQTVQKVQSVARTAVFFGMTAGLSVLWHLGKVSACRDRYSTIKWRNFTVRSWARMARAIANMHVTIEGTPPDPPFLLVSNHLGYIDIISYASQIDCMFVAKSDIARWPLIGPMAQKLDTIFIDRKKIHDVANVIELMEKALNENQGIMIFAEGTSTQGADVLPFKPSLLAPAARMGIPVYYASISYTTPPDQVPAHLSVCWWGGKKFPQHLMGLFANTSFDACITFGVEPIQDGNRKALAKKLHHAVVQQFRPVVVFDDKDQA